MGSSPSKTHTQGFLAGTLTKNSETGWSLSVATQIRNQQLSKEQRKQSQSILDYSALKQDQLLNSPSKSAIKNYSIKKEAKMTPFFSKNDETDKLPMITTRPESRTSNEHLEVNDSQVGRKTGTTV